MTVSSTHTWNDGEAGQRGAEWLDGDWGPVRAGLRVVFWAWLVGAMLSAVQLLHASGVQQLGGAAMSVPVGWVANPFADGFVAYAQVLVAAVVTFGVARIALMPSQAGGPAIPVAATLAFLVAVVLSIAALPSVDTFREGRAMAEAGATLAAVAGSSLLLVALGRAATSLETSARRPLVMSIGVLLGARAMAAVAPLVLGLDVTGAASATLGLLGSLAFLPLLGGLARTMAITAAQDDEPEMVASVNPRDGSDEWTGACAGLAAFSSTLRARLVVVIVAAALGILSMAPAFEPLRPALTGTLRLMAGAIGVAMALSIGRFATLPSGTRARLGAFIALPLVGIGAVADGALSLFSFDQVAFGTPLPASAKVIAVVADAAPLLGLVALSVSFWALAVALGAATVAHRVLAGMKWIVVGMGTAVIVSLAPADTAAPLRIGLAAGAVLLCAVALGRLLGATSALQGRTSRRG